MFVLKKNENNEKFSKFSKKIDNEMDLMIKRI